MDKLFGEAVWVSIFGAGCYVLTLIVRKIVETAQPHLEKKPYQTPFSRWWNQVILYILPILFGALGAIACLGTVAMPPGVESLKAAVVYGMVVGSMSSMLYKVLKMAILKKAGVPSVEMLTAVTLPADGDPKPVVKEPPNAPS